jgi:hypothetical protein
MKELNPKFYKYMPASSLHRIPPAGKVIPHDPQFIIADMYSRNNNRVAAPVYMKAQ